MKPLTTRLIALGIFLTVLGLFFIQPSYVGYAVVLKNPSFGKALAGSGLSIILIASVSEVESIKKYMEKRHRRKLPDFNVDYSDEVESARIISSPIGINTIVLQTPKAMYKTLQKAREYLNKRRGEGAPAEELKNIYRNIQLADYLCKRPEVKIYGDKWHEMGHMLADSYNIPSCALVNEGIAEAYGFKGVLLGVKEGEFSAEDAIRTIKAGIEICKIFKEGDPHKEGHELVLSGFESKIEKFDPYSGDLDELIAELDKRIDYALRPHG